MMSMPKMIRFFVWVSYACLVVAGLVIAADIVGMITGFDLIPVGFFQLAMAGFIGVGTTSCVISGEFPGFDKLYSRSASPINFWIAAVAFYLLSFVFIVHCAMLRME